MTGNGGSECCGPGYASPEEAMKAPRETLLYTVALYIGTGIQKPDYLATIDADPESPTYSQVVSRLEMPGIGDELHHTGWNACSSCHHDPTKERRYLIVPGVRSSNLHIVDCATDPRRPRLHKVIDGAEIKRKTNLSAPHTVHCLGSDIIISMLGDAKGEAPGGYPPPRRGLRDRRALGERPRRHEVQLRLLVPAAPQRHGLQRMGRAQHLHAGLRPRGGRPPEVRPRDPLLELRGRSVSRTRSISARTA